MCGLAAAPAERKREGGARKIKNPPADFSRAGVGGVGSVGSAATQFVSVH
jgi:hypothetical protein